MSDAAPPPELDLTDAKVLYENRFDDAAKWAVEREREWTMEGPGLGEILAEPGGGLRLRSARFTIERAPDGHWTYWLRRDFPKDLAVAWDFRFSDRGPKGLAIVFVCASGRGGGKDIFDDKTAPRDGTFSQYTNGDVDSYHVSYISIGRGKANVRKNSGFHLVASGPDLVTEAGADRWHKLLLARKDNRLWLTVNGKTCVDWTDDGSAGGPPHGGGKLGFRQQNNLYYGDYRNLKVYGL